MKSRGAREITGRLRYEREKKNRTGKEREERERGGGERAKREESALKPVIDSPLTHRIVVSRVAVSLCPIVVPRVRKIASRFTIARIRLSIERNSGDVCKCAFTYSISHLGTRIVSSNSRQIFYLPSIRDSKNFCESPPR